MIDLETITDEELHQLRQAIGAEIERRRIIANAEAQADRIAREYGEAIGRADETEWVQPTGGHDAYPLGATVTHDGKTWENLTPANVWEPGVSGWREVATDPDTGEPTVPEYVQPTGAHDAYKKGDKVTFEGVVYESIIDGNVWNPRDYPAGWKKLS